jgi:hypothetical protein
MGMHHSKVRNHHLLNALHGLGKMGHMQAAEQGVNMME